MVEGFSLSVTVNEALPAVSVQLVDSAACRAGVAAQGECEKTGIQKNTDKRKIWWIFAGYLDERTVKYLKLRLVAERQLPLQNGNKDCD